MTGLIGSLVGAASTAVERIAGGISTRNGTSETSSQFASLLATMTGAAKVAEEEGAADADADMAAGEVPAEVAAALDEAAEAEAAAALEAAQAAAGATEADASGAAAAVAGVAAAEVTKVNRDPENLQPEFRKRLDRVVDRMEAEFGHSVTIVEGVRSQERQNYLYEQGRTRPGNVVTWTRNSNHLSGRAVDVMIDGTYNNPAGYKRLAQIAAEEGLQTLGPKDPGHVELPRNVPGGGMPNVQYASSAPELATTLAAAARSRGAGGLARVAEVARVAQVADVAQVAQVAEVARVADPMRAGGLSAPAAEAPAVLLAARQSGLDGQGSGSSGDRQRENTNASSADLELLRADGGLGGRSFSTGALTEPQLATGSDAVQRAAQILAMKENGSMAPVSHLTLRVDGANGGEDRIRVDLRGNTIGTTLSIENQAEADQLASRVGELRQSLERHGLEAEAVRIRTPQASGIERIETVRTVIAAAEAEAGRNGGNSRSGSDSSSKQEGWKEAQEQQRRDSGEPRNRSRREQPKEERA